MTKIHYKKKRVSKKGLPPGSNIYTGDGQKNEVRIVVHRYSREQFETFAIQKEDLKELFQDTFHKIWIDVEGIHDIETVVSICEEMNIHLLHQEDLLNVYQRPKLEEEEDYIFLIVKMIHHLQDDLMNADVEQLSVILKNNFLITFQENERDVFDPVRERLKKPATRLRERNIDYLLYVLFDVIVDSYLENLVKLEDFQETLENELMMDVGRYNQKNIQDLKKVLLEHKKAIWPLKEVMNKLVRTDKNWIDPLNQKFFIDLQDHVFQAYEMLESQMELHNGIKDLYLHRMNHEMNNVMKVLTIISTIFIPLTFIAGIYGMNFQNMPELHSQNGYFITIGVMFIIGIALFMYFRIKKWI
ncbi:MAG: magnesium/cobalt transporter CorA [Saprospiraceae bacterium]